MPSLNFDEEKQYFRDWFDENSALFTRAVSAYRGLISQLLADQPGFSHPIITGRVKARDECIAKFSRKYQGQCESTQTPYEIKEYISDIVGLRVVCLYETDIPLIRNIVTEQFELIDETDKSANLESHNDTFGYKGLHLDLRLRDNRSSLPEYSRFKDIRFELQIRTTVQDAWSVLDHKIKYKKNIPDSLRRRINRLAALFELADQEFVNIRDETLTLEKPSQTDSLTLTGYQPAVLIEPLRWDIELNAFTFSQVAEKHFPRYVFDGVKIDGFVDEIKRESPRITAAALDELLVDKLPLVNEYRQYQRDQYRNRLNPYTTIRHALYVSDTTKHRAVLFDSQRSTFDQWLTEKEKNK